MPKTAPCPCHKCGQGKNECECWRFSAAIDGFAAPFYNIGRAKSAMASFKFAGAASAAEIFAKYMAERFSSVFPEAEIDAICYVPDSHQNRRRKGYYSAKELAKALADIMELPLCEDILIQVKPSRPQHSLGYKERLKNVKGIYKAGGDLKGKNIIVVDDIKTTGATINECGRMLKKAKANKVFGLTAVMGKNLQYF